MALHPSIDVLVTAGRDSTARVWDMRTKANVHTLVGHTNTVASVICQTAEPQVSKPNNSSNNLIYIFKKIFNYIYFYFFLLLDCHWESRLHCTIMGFSCWKI